MERRQGGSIRKRVWGNRLRFSGCFSWHPERCSREEKSLNRPVLVQSGFVSSVMDDCISVVPRSCAMIKAVLLCTMAASSDLCLGRNVPSFSGEKKEHFRQREKHSCCRNTCRVCSAAAVLQFVLFCVLPRCTQLAVWLELCWLHDCGSVGCCDPGWCHHCNTVILCWLFALWLCSGV